MPKGVHASLDPHHHRGGVFAKPAFHAAKAAERHAPVLDRGDACAVRLFGAVGGADPRGLPVCTQPKRAGTGGAVFAERNFAVGITFKKTEVVLTALVGLAVLGEGVGLAGGLAIAVGFMGLILLSDPPEGGKTGWKRFFNRAAALGLGAGFLFSVSAIGYRGAALSLPAQDVIARAGFTLAVVTAFQSTVMLIWMSLREKGEITRVFAAWRVGVLVGLSSMIGSFCWFTAFALQNAALVKALGQVELLFSYAATLFVFREKVTGREYAGTALILASVLVLVLFLK